MSALSIKVQETIKYIKNNPEDFRPVGNCEFAGFQNNTYKLMHAGNTIAIDFGLFSIINLSIHGVTVNLNRSERYALESLNNWWWKNAPTNQLKTGE